MNVSRRTVRGDVNPYEPHQCQFFMTSAGTKSTYAYEKLVECLENEIIYPESSFVWGCDYRVPVMHGLLDKSYINEIKMSPTFKEDSFARELKSQQLSLNPLNCWKTHQACKLQRNKKL